MLDLAHSLSGGELVSLVLQDDNYDRRPLRHGPIGPIRRLLRFVMRANGAIKRRAGVCVRFLDSALPNLTVVDQTRRPGTLAQIQCIVKKVH